MSGCEREDKTSHPQATHSKSDSSISVLNQHIDDEEGVYRIQYDDIVHYVTISTDVFDEDTMCRPYLLIPKLRELPEQNHVWTRMHVSKNATGSLKISTTTDALPAIRNPLVGIELVDVFSLKAVKRHCSSVHEVFYNELPAIAKIASFDWDFHRLENETWAYSMLEVYRCQHPDELPLSPRVLAHLTENNRIIGLLLEKVEGTFASIEHLRACEASLRRFHAMGLVHGDVNRYNFIVDRSNGHVKMVDFEHAKAFDETAAKLEIESLTTELSEETGRGGPAQVVEEVSS